MRGQIKMTLALTFLAASPALAQQGLQPLILGQPVQTPQARQVGSQLGQPLRTGQAGQLGQQMGQAGLAGQTLLPSQTNLPLQGTLPGQAGQTTLPGRQTPRLGAAGPIGPILLVRPSQPSQQLFLGQDVQPGATLLLFQNPDLRRQLNLNDQQLVRLNNSFNILQGRFRDDLGRLNQLNELQRAAALRELQQNFNAELTRVAGGVLSEQQMNRLRQFDLLRRGPDALNDTNVQFLPNVLAGQQGLRTFGPGAGQQNALQDVGLGREQVQQRFDIFQRLQQEQANAIFLDAQRRGLGQLTGNPSGSPAGSVSTPRP